MGWVLSKSKKRRSSIWVSVAVGALLGLAAVTYLEARSNYALCDLAASQKRNGPAGDTITIETRLCGGLAGDPGTVVVRFRSAVVFAYNPASGQSGSASLPWDPDVSWVSRDQILISISHVSQVQRQRDKVGTVQFSYRIGESDYPASVQH